MKVSKKYKVVIIGLGNIGMKYDLNLQKDIIQTHTKAFLNHPNYDLVAGIDTCKENCDVFFNKYKIKTYLNLEYGLIEKNPDVIVISAPTFTHKEIAKKICSLNLSPKIVLCEKPISYTLEESQEIINLFSNKKIPLFVNYMRRSDPGAIEIKHNIEKNNFKTPIKGFCWYSKGIFNNASHFINLSQYWLGEIKSFQNISFNKKINKFDQENDFFIEFEKGKVFFISLWEEKFSNNSLEICFSNGKLSYSDGGNNLFWQEVINDQIFDGYKILSLKKKKIINEMKISQLNVVKQIDNFLNKKEYFLCSSNQALKTVEIIDSIIKK